MPEVITGQLAAISGATQIVELTAPDSARQGSYVDISVSVTNPLVEYNYYFRTEVFAGADLIFSIGELIRPGEAATYNTGFIMPAEDITVLLWVERLKSLEPEEWVFYGADSKLITLEVEPPPEVWVPLAEEIISIGIPEVVDWVTLAEETISITVLEVVAWVPLTEETISIGILEIVGWVTLAEETISIGITEVVGWVVLAEDELTITSAPKYELIQHTVHPWAYIFEGDTEVCTFEFQLTPEQIPGTDWFREIIINAFVAELEKEESRLLELKVWEDTTPMFWTNYRVEVTATASPLAWNLIIIGVLAILFIVAIYFTIKLVDQVFFKRKPGLEDVKPGWGKDTLIKTIQDSEEYWERPLTPIETLEGMSEAELRGHLDKIAEEEVEPEIDWWILAIVGGLGVLGVGAALALAGPRIRP